MHKTIIAWLVFIALLITLWGGAWLADALGPYNPERDARAEALRAQTESEQAWRAASQPIRLALYAGMAGVATLGCGALLYAGFRYLERRARTIYPDDNGMMPAVILRPGEILADLGALAGPARVTAEGVMYSLPPATVPDLQAGANRGAAVARTTRAWATRQSSRQEALPWPAVDIPHDFRREFPAVEILTGDEAHILRLLEEGGS